MAAGHSSILSLQVETVIDKSRADPADQLSPDGRSPSKVTFSDPAADEATVEVRARIA